MISLKDYGGRPANACMDLYGLSTDEKPTKVFDDKQIENASIFYEMDTGKGYLYDEENHRWLEVE